MSPDRLLYLLREGYEAQTLFIASVFSAKVSPPSCPRVLTLTEEQRRKLYNCQLVNCRLYQLLAFVLCFLATHNASVNVDEDILAQGLVWGTELGLSGILQDIPSMSEEVQCHQSWRRAKVSSGSETNEVSE
jgi:hypothetical protein